MPSVVIDGIETRYEISGSGPALLMFSPGGFNSALENWHAHGLYQRLDLLPRLAQSYQCIAFDRRESGQSGGRLERIAWRSYVDQAVGLLDHLGIDRANLIGACVGCSSAAAFAVAHPRRVQSMTLYSPAGGAAYRRRQHSRFASHLAFVEEFGLAEVVRLATESGGSFSTDGRVGPWSTVIARDAEFAEAYQRCDHERYLTLVSGLGRLMFDRDTVPGAEPEDLVQLDIPTLIVPGEDSSHATSAARYLQECLRGAEYWDVAVAAQTADTAPARVLTFLDGQR